MAIKKGHICSVCGYAWADHTLGGNCTAIPKYLRLDHDEETHKPKKAPTQSRA